MLKVLLLHSCGQNFSSLQILPLIKLFFNTIKNKNNQNQILFRRLKYCRIWNNTNLRDHVTCKESSFSNNRTAKGSLFLLRAEMPTTYAHGFCFTVFLPVMIVEW